MPNAPRLPLRLDDELMDGPHEGKQLVQVIMDDPLYLTWLLEFGRCRLSDEARQAYRNRLDRYANSFLEEGR